MVLASPPEPDVTGASSRPTTSVPGVSGRRSHPSCQQQLGGGAPAAASAEEQRSPEDWVEALVHSMAQARDVPDARQRAATALHAFQEAVVASTNAQVRFSQMWGALNPSRC